MIVSWTIWHEAIEDTRMQEGNNSVVVSNFDNEQKINRAIFEKIYNESF
jgi:hypothetical protein